MLRGWTARFLPPGSAWTDGPTLVLGVHKIASYARFSILKKPNFNPILDFYGPTSQSGLSLRTLILWWRNQYCSNMGCSCSRWTIKHHGSWMECKFQCHPYNDWESVWYVCLNYNFQFFWKYVWVKKCVKIRVMLFKNWKYVFKYMCVYIYIYILCVS